MKVPVILIGAGGHAKVLLNTLRLLGVPVTGLTDVNPATHGTEVMGTRVLGGDDVLANHPPGTVLLVNAVGSIGDTTARRAVYEKLRAKGYRFRDVIHPGAHVAEGVDVGPGAQIMAGAVIQPGTRISADCVINTGALVDHDCALGQSCFLAPGSVLSGGVAVGAGAHVGAGAVVLQQLTVGERAVIGAGAVVTRDVPAGITVIGVPARAR